MLAGDLASVARAALVDGDAALSQFILQPFQPVQPMLAESAADVGDALATLGEASFEYKLDGARIQVHKVGDEVKVYSRTLRDVTHRRARGRDRRARDAGARDRPRRRSHRAAAGRQRRIRFRSRCAASAGSSTSRACRQELPITPMFFDALYLDGDPLLDEPLTQARRAARRAGRAGEPRAAAS